MEFIERPDPVLNNGHYTFDLEIPPDRSGQHVLWIAWQRNDPVGEVFFSTSDLSITPSSCIETLNLESITQSTYHASHSIQCHASIASPNDVIFKAGDFIKLEPSFEIEQGASLALYIEACVANKALPLKPLGGGEMVPNDRMILQRRQKKLDTNR